MIASNLDKYNIMSCSTCIHTNRKLFSFFATVDPWIHQNSQANTTWPSPKHWSNTILKPILDTDSNNVYVMNDIATQTICVNGKYILSISATVLSFFLHFFLRLSFICVNLMKRWRSTTFFSLICACLGNSLIFTKCKKSLFSKQQSFSAWR